MSKSVLWLILSLIFATSLSAQTLDMLKNDREKSSFFSKTIYQKKINLLTIEYDSLWIGNILSDALSASKENSQCLLDINYQLGTFISTAALSRFEFYLLARRYNLIDDYFLEQALMVSHMTINPQEIRAFEIKDTEKSDLAIFFKASKKGCVLDQWRTYLQKLQGKNKHLFQGKVKKALEQDVQELAISYVLNSSLKELKGLKLQKEKIASLKNYLEAKKILRAKYPIDQDDEPSDFIIDKVKKIKRSKRNILFSTYNAKAIEKMSQVMVRLIEHVESPKMELNIFNNNDAIIRTVEFTPMDRFRFAIRYLRTQMNELQLDVDFKGRIPSYDDIILSAFETNIIKSSDLRELASLEEVWSPTQTLWKKSLTWIKLFVPIASIVIPPPFNILASITLIIIELTTKKPEPGYDHALFMDI